jgi:hypothetical protein
MARDRAPVAIKPAPCRMANDNGNGLATIKISNRILVESRLAGKRAAGGKQTDRYSQTQRNFAFHDRLRSPLHELE